MADHLDTELLRTLVAIADAGGFTRAAQLVHRTQSAVSMQMKRLEEQVGQPLFTRQGRNLVLTLEGETLLGYARRILKLHDEVLTSLRAPHMVGNVVVGTPDDYVMRFMPSILLRFAHCYPQIQVEVRCETSERLLQTIDDGEIDLALITCEPSAEVGAPLRRETTVWATSRRHFIHEQRPVPLALFNTGCFFRAWAQRALNRAEIDYHITYCSPSIAGIQAVVTAGLAVTVLGRSILPPEMRELRAEEGFPPLPTATISLLRGKRQNSPVVDCMARYIEEGFRQESLPAWGQAETDLAS